ncbi:MAG TPA: Ig-like domain-containing protein, partial [Acidimicrobiia bacterium]|nr:Ig-like domain-containing protein [Acidimicrobiia bacterium]
MNRKLRRLQGGLLGACLSASVLATPGLVGVAHAADENPIATRDFVAVRSGQTVTVDVILNDADDETDSEELDVTAVGGAEPGTATLVGSEVRYAAPAGFYGSDSFAYVVEDGGGNSATGTVDVFVYPDDPSVNDPGFARNDFAAVVNTGSVTVDVLLNDVDPEGDPIAPILNVSDPAHGTAVNNGTTVIYTPDTNYVGNDSFTYALAGPGATAKVNITVIDTSGTAEAPRPAPDQIHAWDGESIQIPVLNNDADANGGGLTLTGAAVLGLDGDPDEELPARGTATVDGNFVQFDAGPFTGSVFIEYTVEDPDGNEATGFVEVLVTPYDVPAANDAPIANPDLATVYAGQTLGVAVLQNDVDAEGDELTLRSVDSLGGGFAIHDDGYAVFQAPAIAKDAVVVLTYRIRAGGQE